MPNPAQHNAISDNVSYVHTPLYIFCFNRYNGTVLLVRRTDDEILCIPNNSLAGNRGNMLLMKLLLRRYPHLFSETSESGTVLSRFLSAEASDRSKKFNSLLQYC